MLAEVWPALSLDFLKRAQTFAKNWQTLTTTCQELAYDAHTEVLIALGGPLRKGDGFTADRRLGAEVRVTVEKEFKEVLPDGGLFL